MDARPALALGGGIGHAGDVCGAVNGAAVAIGQLVADHEPDLQAAKLLARQLALAYYRDFEARFGAVDCRSLIGIDISTEEGFQQYMTGTLKPERCNALVIYAVQRLLPLAEEVRQRTAKKAE